ncbi:MAG TPA: ROK family protein [Candidatus Dormibacteraeota bacterium]|nr:ROK family protein [Candidatus Dormibacteraeota bacterium]
MNAHSHLRLALVAPTVVPALDPEFRPAWPALRAFREEAGTRAVPVQVAVERGDGGISRFDTTLAEPSSPAASGNFFHLERLIKFLLWSRGGWRVHFHGPNELGRRLQAHFRDTPTGRFDAELMGGRVYEKPFEVKLAQNASEVPSADESSAPLGRHLDGCRIGFDLGASDRKVAAVIDGRTVFSDETLWDPRAHSDPQWHFDQIMDSLRRAAAHLPRVDAIGGSAAGVYVHNRVRVASLFRGVPDDLFARRVQGLFLEIKRAWNDVPLEVVNDGEVTALAGAMALEDNAVLGVALGSSQAVGYVNPDGNITPWLNELAFAPVDYNPGAPIDEWSGDRGCGVQYFSQQCVARLLPKAGIDVDPQLPLPQRLIHVQQLMNNGDERAARIYETIGVYLGYALAQYAQFYTLRHLLMLGRVTTGPGGEIILRHARKVLEVEFPELARTVAFHVPDEKQKRHGQAMAAASLPVLGQPRSSGKSR